MYFEILGQGPRLRSQYGYQFIMMQRYFLLVSLFFAFLDPTMAQAKEPEFGKVDASELSMKDCSFEREASSMNLIRTAKISFESRISEKVPKVYTDYWVRIKIFKRQGFSTANIQIPYVSKSRQTSISDVQAFIYNLDSNGSIIKEKLERKQIFKEKSRSRNAVNTIAFTFANLQEGSVIEYRYTKTDRYSYRVEPWFFQDEVPTAFSRVTLDLPSRLSLNAHFIALESIQKDSSHKKNGGGFYDEDIISFTVKNVHSFRMEPFMSSLSDNLERVEFAVSPRNYYQGLLNRNSDWENINSLLLNASYFGFQFDKLLDSTTHLVDSVKKMERIEARIAAVYDYVKSHVEWNGELTCYCDSIEVCWKNKTANSAEMNIMLLDLLRKSGIKCYPVLVSTRENGRADDSFESLSQFNNVDVIVTDSDNLFILDCTQKGLSYKMPPQNVLNSKGFIVDPNLQKWIYITDTRILMQNEVTVKAFMDSLGNVTVDSRLSFIGFAKSETLAERKKNKDKASKEETDLSGSGEDLIIDSVIEIRNDENCDTLEQKMRFHLAVSSTGDDYFLNPFLFSFFRKNPFTDSFRLYDVDFGCAQSYQMSVYLQVPDNFSIEDFPKGISIRMQDSSILFRRETFQQNHELLIRTKFTVANPEFTRENYFALKSFFDKVYGIINDLILFKKH
jgi:hypothetical protein